MHPLGREILHVYLTYDGGTPLVHLSRRFDSDKDPDLVASMFTALQNFMDESFQALHAGAVRSMEIGKQHHVAFGRGKKLLMYVMYKGRESNRLEDHVIRTVGDLEARFDGLLASWNGDMDAVEPIRRYLEETWELHELQPVGAPMPPVADAP